jgi:undecaprenyl-diphosphatase
MHITLEVLLDFAKIGFTVAGLYAAIALYMRHRQPDWSLALQRRRLALVWALLAIAGAIQITEDVLGGESAPLDKALLLYLRELIPHSLDLLFKAITWTGSVQVLDSLALFTVVLWLVLKHRFEAMLVAVSVIGAEGTVYLMKALIGRERPQLWGIQWYEGPSFPSGHVLALAAYATAAALGVARRYPRARRIAINLALLWIAMMALSRLVLGAHWPTDVLAAACIGAGLPLLVSLGHDMWRARQAKLTQALSALGANRPSP